jgi:hypothetical protein
MANELFSLFLLVAKGLPRMTQRKGALSTRALVHDTERHFSLNGVHSSQVGRWLETQANDC